MSPPSYDLCVRAAVKAKTETGTVESFSLPDLFLRAHEVLDVEAGFPPSASSMWRLLTLIAARVTGLDDPGESKNEWLERREEVLEEGTFDSDAIHAYFQKYVFDLFHPDRPWLQDPRLKTQCTKTTGLNKFVLARPAGNNQPWVLHHHDGNPIPISSEEAVLHLVAQLYYGPSGRCTSRTVNGKTFANSNAGPLRSSISFHLVAGNLFETLVANIPYLEDPSEDLDAAPWELDELPDPLSAPPVPSGVGGVLAGRFRHALLLVPDEKGQTVVDAYITWAWREPHPSVEDPFLIYQTNKEGQPYARSASADRGLWRDLDGLLLKDVGIEHRRRPDVLDTAEELPSEFLARLKVRAFAFDQDGQTRDRQWYSAVTPPVLDLLLDTEAAGGVSRVREAAERVERHLRGALRTAWVAINDPKNGDGPPARKDIGTGPWPSLAAARYWPDAESRFWDRVFNRRFDDPVHDFIQIALNAYDQVTDQAGARPRNKRAIERARGFIFQASNLAKGTS